MRRFALVLLTLWIALIATTGCAVQTQRLLSAPPADLPAQVELAHTPFFTQQDHYCGPASLAMVLGAAGLAVDPATLVNEVFVPGRQGSLQIEMLASARRHGAVATVVPGTLEALMRETAGGRPVLVLQNLGLSWAPSWHYAVVIGYDLNARTVLLRSGQMPRQALPLSTFEHTWNRAGRWAFVALPAGALSASADEPSTVRALVAFERTATPKAAQQAYAAALQRWPHSLTLAMGLGNAHYAAGDLRAAEDTFRAAAQQHGAAAAYNNLAMVLLEQHRCDAAHAAAAQAHERGGASDKAIEDTLQRIENARREPHRCENKAP